MFRVGKSTETEGRSVIFGDRGKQDVGRGTAKRCSIFWGDGNVLELDRGNGCVTL